MRISHKYKKRHCLLLQTIHTFTYTTNTFVGRWICVIKWAVSNNSACSGTSVSVTVIFMSYAHLINWTGLTNGKLLSINEIESDFQVKLQHSGIVSTTIINYMFISSQLIDNCSVYTHIVCFLNCKSPNWFHCSFWFTCQIL